MDTFPGKTKLPHVVGAIDGTHVEIIKPQWVSAFDYFSRKQVYTISNQAACDGNLAILYGDAGFPGSIHHSRMLENSWIYLEADDGGILNIRITNINNTAICPYLLGDPAYPVLKWLMKPYAHGMNDSLGQEAVLTEHLDCLREDGVF